MKSSIKYISLGFMLCFSMFYSFNHPNLFLILLLITIGGIILIFKGISLTEKEEILPSDQVKLNHMNEMIVQ